MAHVAGLRICFFFFFCYCGHLGIRVLPRTGKWAHALTCEYDRLMIPQAYVVERLPQLWKYIMLPVVAFLFTLYRGKCYIVLM